MKKARPQLTQFWLFLSNPNDYKDIYLTWAQLGNNNAYFLGIPDHAVFHRLDIFLLSAPLGLIEFGFHLDLDICPLLYPGLERAARRNPTVAILAKARFRIVLLLTANVDLPGRLEITEVHANDLERFVPPDTTHRFHFGNEGSIGRM